MTAIDLEAKLRQHNIPSSSYSLKGGLPNEAYCLERLTDKWAVYYSERGSKTSLKEFTTENEACEYFIQLMSKAFVVLQLSNKKM
jgi:hypothetical protein